MILHYHYSSNPNSGEIRRIRNINNEICRELNTDCIEVEFYSLRERTSVINEWKFILSSNVIKKYYVPLIPFSGKSKIIQYICDFWTSLVIFLISIKYKTQFVIGEYSTSYAAMRFKRFIKSIYIADMHGALAEEYIYNNPNVIKWKLEYITKLELLTSQKADYIICQSEEMKRHIVRKYNARSNCVYVYKCGVDTSLFILSDTIRCEVRKELGFEKDDFVFVYSGGLMKWQKVEESLLIFEQVFKYNKKCKFLILTKDFDKVKILLEKLNIEYLKSYVKALSSPFDKVYSYLNAADAAFLLRDDDVMNRVASPTKLAEYMACGLPVISTPVASCWVSQEMINDYAIICYNSNSDVNKLIDKAKLADKKSIRNYAVEFFSLSIDSKNIVELFGKIRNTCKS